MPLPKMLVHVTRAAPPPSEDPLEYVMSDSSVDRFGDIVDQQGWRLDNFHRNPIALFNHKTDFVLGQWRDVRVVNGELRGRLDLLDPVSDRQREVNAAAKAGVLRGVSVGILVERDNVKPLEGAPRGVRFLNPELVECSLVSIPANRNALAITRSLGLSREATDLIFGVRAERDRTSAGGISGVRAGNPPSRKTQMQISERIERTQDRLNGLRDQLATHLDNHEEMDDQALGLQDELNRRITAVTRELEGYRASEIALAIGADPAAPPPAPAPAPSTSLVPQQRAGLPATMTNDLRPFAVPAAKLEPMDYAYRALAIAAYAHVHSMTKADARKLMYGEDAVTRGVADYVLRAATVPADTVTPAWAGVLGQTINADFLPTLIPASVYSQLRAYGPRYTLGRNAVINIPSRSATPTIAGSFVAEGAPIPVRQGAFVAIPLGLKKMAVISTMTREISEHSIPALPMLIEDAIKEDTQVSIDVVLLDANPATAIRPAGIRNGVSVTAPTAGGGQAALVGDIGKLSGALIAATNGNVRTPVWLMNPGVANKIALMTNAMGVFPFRDEINQGRLNRWPVIESGTVPIDMLILLDAADFASVTGDDPRFDVSDQATIHMEDTTPLAIGSVGAPAVVAAPTRSLWQTDSLGIRMVLPMNWALRRTGVVAWTQPITW